MKPSDVGDLVEASDPRVSPDGATIAFVVTRPDLATNLYRTAIWVTGLDPDLPPIPLTTGDDRDGKPRWSPDGMRLAYVSHPDEQGSAIVVADVEGGASYEIARLPEEVDDLSWTPDGSALVFTTRHRDEAYYGPEKDRDRPPRRVDRVAFRLDNVGWTIDRPKHVFVIAVDGDRAGEVRELTTGPFADAGVTVSPDGLTVVFSAARTPTWDTDLSTHLYRLAIGGGEIEQLTTGSTLHGQPAFSPDGTHVAFVWGDRHSMMRHGQVGVVDVTAADPASTERLLTTVLDLHCAPYLAGAREPLWDGDTLLFQVDEGGNVPLYRVGLDGGPPVAVVTGERQVTGFDMAGGTLAFTASGATTLADVFVLVGGEERCLTAHAATYASRHRVSEPERFVATSADGTAIDAWVMRPPALAAGEKCPVVLNIHGGPFSQYGNRFFDEFQVQASAGYAVVYGNPRGSSGYSEAFSRAIRGPKATDDPGSGWGGVDYEDVIAIADAALQQFDFLDGDRFGVMGGSYGGYMTSWVVGHTDRFKAAVSERACNNLLTFAHTSDIGAQFPAGYIGASHLDDPDEFVRQSPTTYWRDIATPLLILHSENDLRCPIEQAEDLFLRLKLSGRDVEFVRFPGESHELSRSGAPRHRVERLEVILDWFERHLR
ncbi:MAG TPA: S9 family peptidase [Acidimicrobiales bacterium]